MNTPQLLAECVSIVGANHVKPKSAQTPKSWLAPLAVVTPQTAEQVVALVRLAEQAEVALLPCGGGTQLSAGYAPDAARPYLLLQTTALNAIIDYQPDDLTLTCQPGTTLAQAQASLAPRRQMLALDASLAERATLGGLVSTNGSGFWRPGFGAPRDLLIGLKAVMAGGVEVKGGGRVVKNVAGYDVCKLFTGAWGTLGVLTELTFKIRTRPETERTLAWATPDLATAAQLGLNLHHAQLAPTYLLVTNELDDKPHLVIGLHGSTARTEWQAGEFARRMAEAGIVAQAEELSEERIAALRDAQARLDAPLAARVSCLPADLPELLQRLEVHPTLRLTGHCATGLLSIGAPEAEFTATQTVRQALPREHNLIWQKLEGLETAELPVWGAPRAEFFLHRALKESLDPQRTFSPGRFLGGL